MKTKWMILPVVALALGCSREMDTNVTYIDGEFTLYASSGDNGTKTVLQQDGRVFWSPSDCITVFYGNIPGKFTSTNTEPAASAEFTGSLGSFVLDGETEFKAIYPHSDIIVTPTDEGILSIYLPPEQTAVEGTFADDLFICVAKSKDVNLHFYNVCGGVKFSLERDDIKKVVFRGNNKETLAGTMFVDFAADGIPQVIDFTAGRSSVTLSAPEGETLKKGVWYYLVTAPQNLSQGYTMELWADEIVETVSSESAVTIRRSAWGVLKDIGSTTTTVEVPEAIDLGLPSGLKWASFNLGATKPEEYGNYYAWGETEPYYSSLDPLTWKVEKDCGYDYSSNRWFLTGVAVSKYNDGSIEGNIDNKILLDLEDDAAHVNLGEEWRMPTRDEQEELKSKCKWEWCSLNGVKGCKVTGPNGNSIFLPAAGYWGGTTHFSAESRGDYWSSTVSTYKSYFALMLSFSSSSRSCTSGSRYYGQSIRPVFGPFSIPVQTISLNRNELNLNYGETSPLIATILPENATNPNVTWSSSDESVATVTYWGEVTGRASGTAIITVSSTDGNKTASCVVTVRQSSSIATPAAIDLGLPSGLKWASFNLGALRPEEYGDYYAWGEIEPYYSNLDPFTWKPGKESGYTWSSYSLCLGSRNTFTKYCYDSDYGYTGFTDNKTTLDQEDDVAYMNLCGEWRIPTTEDFKELLENCNREWAYLNGVQGLWIIGPNSNRIFLPAAGFREYYKHYSSGGGFYWSSSLSSDSPQEANILLVEDSVMDIRTRDRYYGLSIRSVYGLSATHVSSITLNETKLELNIGESSTLVASILPENATNKNVSWVSSNETVATVSSTGMITGLSVGTASITVITEDGGKSATCHVDVKEGPYSVAVPEIIDLGLSVKWASFNLGATKPVEYGDYFAWGETRPKQDYGWSTYKWCMGEEKTITKYCIDSEYGYNGYTDGETVLDLDDDAAHVNLGNHWRIPTEEERDELRSFCTWEWDYTSNVNGYKVTGPNGNSIFIPAAGYRNGDSLCNVGTYGFYWTSSLSAVSGSDTSHPLSFGSDFVAFGSFQRYSGLSIRPVYAE